MNVVDRYSPPREELIRLCIQAAHELPKLTKAGSTKADYLAEILATPILSVNPDGCISLQAVRGKPPKGKSRGIKGVSTALKKLESCNVNISGLVRHFLLHDPKNFSEENLAELKKFGHLPEDFGTKAKRDFIIKSNLGTIFYWKQRRAGGLKRQRDFLKKIARQRKEIYGDKRQERLFEREDIIDLVRQGIPLEEFVRDLIREEKPKQKKARGMQFKRKIGRKPLI